MKNDTARLNIAERYINNTMFSLVPFKAGHEIIDNKLVNPKLLLDLPYQPGPAHNGGVITIGPDNNVYVMVGNFLL